MKNSMTVVLAFSGIVAAGTASVADAQLTRTFVSVLGDDTHDCSRAAPCRTLGNAVDNTATGGEVDVLDSGGYGPVRVNKSVTIDGSGVVAGITALDGGDGVTVDAGNDAIVILRNLSINGAGIGQRGVFFLTGKQLIIEGSRIFGFTSAGVYAPTVQPFYAVGTLVITNSTISNKVVGSAADGLRINRGVTSISHSVISGNDGVGLLAQNTGVINADSNLLTGNGVAVQAGAIFGGTASATVRLSNNDVYGNLTGFGCGNGVLASAGNNRKGSNVGGSFATCTPTVVITQQ